MDAIKLMELAESKIKEGSLTFIDQTEKALGFLRSKGVLPIKRASLNGQLHVNYSAMLVQALELGTTVDVLTRRQATLHERGVTTALVGWLDDSVKNDVLVPVNGASNAQGALQLSDLFKKVIT